VAQDTSCLFSTVRNTSGETKTFGFLPPHGRKLNNDEEFTIFGHVTEAIIRHDRTESRRSVSAFLAATQRGDITVVSTPAPILHDEDGDRSQMLTFRGGNLGVADPCWTSSVSAAPANN
jgi:hypothetical protein